MIQKLLNWIWKFFKKEKKYSYLVVKDMPDKLKSGILYIFDNNGYHWQIVMLCPCGCKEILYLNLVEDYHPNWKYVIDTKNQVSVSPSLHRKTGCESHFFIKKANIEWCH